MLDAFYDLYHNDYSPKHGDKLVTDLLLFDRDMSEAMRKQFVFEQSSTILRLSQLGKMPAMEALARKVGIFPEPKPINHKSKLIFSLGDWFEAYCIFLMRYCGYKVHREQEEVMWNGVPGHIDCVVNDGNQDWLVEIKTTSDYYFKKCLKTTYPDDERGYLTQLSTYSEILGLPAVWILLNKQTHAIAILPLSNAPEKFRNQRLARAKEVIDIFNECETREDVYRLSQPVPPQIEKLRSGEYVLNDDGSLKLYPHYAMSHPDFYYKLALGKTRHGKERHYVVDYNYPSDLQHYKPDVFEQARMYDEF